MLFLECLQFLFVLYDCKEKNILQAEKVQEIVECRDLFGRYLNEDYIVPEYTVKNQNPVRIKIELSKPNMMSSKQILTIIQNVVTIKALDYFTKESLQGRIFKVGETDSYPIMLEYLNELTSSYYADKVMEYIQKNVKLPEGAYIW